MCMYVCVYKYVCKSVCVLDVSICVRDCICKQTLG